MKINKLEINNFKSIDSFNIDFDKTISVFTGKNGTGKTSILEAFIYALTGNCPNDCINFNANELSVKAYLPTFNFERIQVRNKPNKVKFNDKTSTAKIINEEIKNTYDITNHEIEAVLFTDLIKNSKNSADLEKFMLPYFNEQLELKEITDLFPNSYKEMTSKEIEEAKKVLPDYLSNIGPYSFEDIDGIVNDLRDSRKYLKKKKQEIDGIVANIPDYSCSRSEVEVNKEYNTIIKKEASQAENKKLIMAYNTAKSTREKQETELKNLQEIVNKINVEKTPDVVLKSIKDVLNTLQTSIIRSEKSKTSLENSLNILNNALSNLNKPFCPLSDKLVCTIDKTPVKQELESDIKDISENINDEKKTLLELKKEYEEKTKELENLLSNDREYEKKCLYLKNINSLKQTLVQVPEKPNMDIIDYSIAKKELESELNKIRKVKEKESYMVQSKEIEKQIKLLDFLILELDAKGDVRESIVSKNLSWLNDFINTRLNKAFPNAKIELVSDEGIKIYAKYNKNNEMTQFDNLSGGEKVITLLYVLDLINMSTQTNILILDGDDISKLDEDVLEKTLDFIFDDSFSSQYDHILLNLINDKKNMKLLKKYTSKINQYDL